MISLGLGLGLQHSAPLSGGASFSRPSITAPDGVYAGAPLAITGGKPVAILGGGYVILGDGSVILAYVFQFVINGTPVGDWFTERETTIPMFVVEGDSIQIKDAYGNLSNSVVATWEPDASDYFSRVSTDGGGFDQTIIDEDYTSVYVKSGINRVFARLKSEGIWPKIDEFYFHLGVNFDGIFQKAKYVSDPDLTNINFVSGDYVGAGPGAGMMGDGVSKMVNSNYLYSGSSITNSSYGAYLTTNLTGAAMGARNAGQIIQLSSAVGDHMHFGNPGRVDFSPAGTSTRNGFLSGVGSASDVRIFRNGVFNAALGSAGNTTSVPITFRLWEGGTGIEYSSSRIMFHFIGKAMSDSEMLTFFEIINEYVTSLGSNPS